MIREWHDRRLKAQADAALPSLIAFLNASNIRFWNSETVCLSLTPQPVPRMVFRQLNLKEYDTWLGLPRMNVCFSYEQINPHLVAPIKAYLALRE